MSKGPTPEERNRMVADAMRKMAAGQAMRESTDLDQLVNRLKALISRVNSHMNSIDAAVVAAGASHDRGKLKEESARMFLEGLNGFNRDEMLFLFTHVLSDLAVREIV